MSEKFEVGEVAIYHRPGSVFHGVEVTISGPLEYCSACDFGVTSYDWRYSIERAAGFPADPMASPKYLRKLPPKREDHQLVKWGECPWQPSRERSFTREEAKAYREFIEEFFN